MANFLFLGGAGFIGSAVVRQVLKDDSSKVVVLEPAGASLRRLKGLDVTAIRGCLSETDKIERTIDDYRIDCVVHLVSTMLPNSSFEEYRNELSQVVSPTFDIVHLCSRKGVRFAFFSTGGAIYGNNSGDLINEGSTVAPISYYGLSKSLIEAFIKYEGAANGLRYIIFRPSNPYGKGQNIHGRQGLISVALGKAMEGEPLTVWGDGSAVKDYIFIDDLAEAVSALLSSDIKGEVVNIGSGTGCSVNQIIEIVRDVTGKELEVIYSDKRDTDVSRFVLDIGKLKSLVSVSMRPLETGIRQYYQYLKSQDEQL